LTGYAVTNRGLAPSVSTIQTVVNFMS
jgi:hypothetical protein